MKRSFVGVLLLLGATSVTPLCLIGQADSVTIVPGPSYAPRNSLHSALLGSEYRELWTTPIRVPLLDLDSYAGGLMPVRSGGFQQTRSLRLINGQGREFNFRSVDKELTPAMPDFAKETFADWVRQDQTSSQLPAGPVVASALLDAVGVLNPGPELFVMPDDASLGEFRTEFAGVLGTLEVHPDEATDESPAFGGADAVAGTDRLLEHMREDLDDRVDSRAFLKARLMDVFMGDWDRHERQWRWARYDRDDLRWWVAIPEDRDYAFVNYDGLLLDFTRRFGIIRMVRFGREYSHLLAMVDNSLELTRQFLGDLPYEAWDSTANVLRTGLTDQVIRDAVAKMPESHHRLVGAELTATLMARRDALPGVTREFYLLLNEVAEVHGTEQDDDVQVRRFADGSLEVTLIAGGDRSFPPRFQRTFLPDETREVRVYLYEGADEVGITGDGSRIKVRIIGGTGDDRIVDESSGPSALYDSRGDNTLVAGDDTSIERRPWRGGIEEQMEALVTDEEADAAAAAAAESEAASDLLPILARDWGERFSVFTPQIGWRGAAELVVGGGPVYTGYGFLHRPHAARFDLTALVAPFHGRFEVTAGADIRPANTGRWYDLRATATQLDATHFRGFGNDSPNFSPEESRVWHDRFAFEATVREPLGDSFEASVGAVAEFLDPRPEPGTPADALPFEATRRTRRAGANAGLLIDVRDSRVFPRSGFRAALNGSGFAPVLDVEDPFGRADLVASGYLSLPGAVPGVLAVRAGGEMIFGDAPFYDNAFIGGTGSLRGHRFQRFNGDRSLFGNAELRMPITEVELLVRGDLGATVFGDAGRVYLEGESPGGWHTAAGAGLWLAIPIGVMNVSYAYGEEDRLYFHLGVPY